jgi:hypothetical protein
MRFRNLEVAERPNLLPDCRRNGTGSRNGMEQGDFKMGGGLRALARRDARVIAMTPRSAAYARGNWSG